MASIEQIIADIETLGGTYQTREKTTNRLIEVDYTKVLRMAREYAAAGYNVEIKDCSNPDQWYVEINNRKGCAYGQFTWLGL